MKIVKKYEKINFKPIKIEITIETKKEFKDFLESLREVNENGEISNILEEFLLDLQGTIEYE